MKKEKIKKEMESSIKYFKSCVKCKKCGHTLHLHGKDKELCEYCGRYIFKDKKTEFLYRMNNLR